MRPLLDPQELAEQGPAEAIRLPVELVDANPANPRQQLLEVAELAENIHQFGLLQPVTVRRAGQRYELLGGHRRRAAFLLLAERFPHEIQWKTIPAVVRTADDDAAYLMLLSGQVHSRNWKPREEAHALEILAIDHTLAQIGALLHRGESWASRRLRVYSDSVLSGFVQAGLLATTVAEELLLARDVAVRKELAQQAVDHQWNQAQARTAVRRLRLGKQLKELGRAAHAMLDLLSQIDPTQLPPRTTNDLLLLRNRIDALARGGRPILPSIEQAQKAAGVNPDKPAPRRRTRIRTT